MEQLDAGGRRRRLRADADPAAARAVPRPAARGDRARRTSRRFRCRARAPATTCARRRDVPDRRAPEEDRRAGHSRRRLDGSDRRARSSASDTQLASLELCLDANELIGACDAGYSCAYANTISLARRRRRRCRWRTIRARCSSGCSATATAPTQAARLARIQRGPQHPRLAGRRKSRGCSGGSGPATAPSSTQYLDAVRDVERRIQKAEEQSDRELPALEQPSGGIPATFDEHAKLMFDLQVLAYPVRPDPRHHVHDVARGEPADLPGDRRARPASRAVAPPEQPGEDREAGEDQHLPHRAVRLLPRASCRRRPTATARCSIT